MKENINDKVIKDLRERVEITKPIADLVNKKYNEFFEYWAVCYSADSFDAENLFFPVLSTRELSFSPSELYNKSWSVNESSPQYFEKFGSDCLVKVPEKFSDGVIVLALTHGETFGRQAMFIPTKLLTGRNHGLYNTLKEFTPKNTKHCEYFPTRYYDDFLGMRSEVTHAVVLWESNENGDYDISVRWIHENRITIDIFISINRVFEHLWNGVDESVILGDLF
jgi:hypothetical protein